MSRLQKGGRITRGETLSFRFDGQDMSGHPGDTLASALLANDVRLLGRSFKYHRKRGIMTAGPDEPNGLVTLANGVPNVRVTTQELYGGLEAVSQNRWPSLKTDIGVLADLGHRFLGAGFYTKTFMWPPGFWEKVYEPLIRRAAGLGRLPETPGATVYDKAWAHCDILVIGGGLAGIMAALTAGRAGVRVILAEEDFEFGGRILSETYRIDDGPGMDWVAARITELAEMPNVRLMPRTSVVGAYDGTWAALERVAEHLASVPEGLPRQVFWRFTSRRTILASGALERMIAFPGNDLPGVMLSSAARSYVTRFGVSPGKRVAIFTNNNDGWRTARDLDLAQIPIAALIDTREDVEPQAATARVIKGGQVIAAKGRGALEEIVVRTASGTERLAVDCLLVSGGWNPNLALTTHLGAKPVWNDEIAAFVPARDAVPGLSVAGAVSGAFTSRAALVGGETEAAVALRELDIDPGELSPPPKTNDAPVAVSPLWRVAAKGRAFVDFHNDVTVADLEQAHQENLRAPEHVKRYTTIGMGVDQGRLGASAAMGILAELNGTGPEEGALSFRPPVVPVSIGAWGAGATGDGFAPVRQSPVQVWTDMQDAPVAHAGLWRVPGLYRRDGETRWRQSVDREVRMTRQAVGICDLSPLGKIAVAGKDAEAFLDRIYCNSIKGLDVGRVRYGLMLRDDGFVLDDGTCTRIAKAEYLLTSSVATEAEVLSHLEFCAQCLWPEMEVHIANVTDQWAQIAVVGPKSRDVIGCLTGAEPVADGLARFSYVECRFHGVTGRIFRICHAGGLGFELAVPARWGTWLMAELVAEAEELGGGPFGVEALDVLRIEHGHLSHAEINGQTTAGDLGLGHFLPLGKSFIGKEGAQRPGLNGPERMQLVGLRPAGAVKQIVAGAHILDPDAPRTFAADRGHVTSACYSPTLDSTLGLALVVNGRARIGARLRAVDALQGIETLCEVVPHRFSAGSGQGEG